jgi:sugar (pentulose or hexulose) kinase
MPKAVIAIIDVGKTNKKLFLFDEDYNMVYERTARFTETVDEDGFPCENIESVRLSLFDSLRDVFSKKEFDVKAINFSTYGASFVYLDENGNTITPLYNYLKPYPEDLKKQFYDTYGGEENFSRLTASPVLGSLNSGMQLYRLKHEKPEAFHEIKYALHLPQYLNYIVTGKAYSDITSIGCHTNLWDFEKNNYHDWVSEEGVLEKLAPVMPSTHVGQAAFPMSKATVGVGLHDSSAALIPYLVNFNYPFLLISTGTWCISLNPFNDSTLTLGELENDCLKYLNYKGKPVKASRIFAGFNHDEQVRKIAAHFNMEASEFKTMAFNTHFLKSFTEKYKLDFPALLRSGSANALQFLSRNLSDFKTGEEAYYQLTIDLVAQQYASSQLVLQGTTISRVFVDGGFSQNSVYMNILACAFDKMEVFAASMAQATALGAALAIHKTWQKKSMPNDLIELKYYANTYCSEPI